MNTTPVSLLERIRNPEEQSAWRRFVEMYTPLMYSWACRMGLQESDAADLVQEVFAVLIVRLPEFVYDRKKSFRGWLRTVLSNKWRDRQRRRSAEPWVEGDDALADHPGPAGPEAFWETE